MIRLLASCVVLSANVSAHPIVPAPDKVEITPNVFFRLGPATPVSRSGIGPALPEYLEQQLHRAFNLRLAPGAGRTSAGIVLAVDPNGLLGSDYVLDVTESGVVIGGINEEGVFHGIQTLLQLIPREPSPDGMFHIPACSIRDTPRFTWRGLMLDSSRHIQSVAEIKTLIDQMALYKFNVLHWHLTDDQGWRIEIKSRPKLTEVGAWRVPREGIWWSRPGPQPGEKPTYGGFYTHDEIREIVTYAAARFIRIVPEIDIPGHSMAILAAYPELSTTGGPFAVNPGSQFYNTIENTLDPSNPETFRLLDDVFTEVAALFPDPYIHMGGDECTKKFWEADPDCRKLMETEKLKNTGELQSWFVKKVEKIIQSKGKKLIGWDEILEGGLAESATVMSWRGKDGGIAAAKAGHPVVMSPSPAYYLDLYQGHPQIEPPTYGMARLKDTWAFDPTLPAGTDPKLLLGIQGNIWTEEIPNFRHLQYMTWPRAFAIAEAAWSKPDSTRDWNGFVGRVEAQFRLFDSLGWHYSRSIYDPAVSVSADGKTITLTPEIAGLEIHYSFDDTEPDATYPKYAGPLAVPLGASSLRTRTYRAGQPVGRLTWIAIREIASEKRTP